MARSDKGNIEVVRMLEDYQSRSLSSLLFIAAQKGDCQTVMKVLRESDINLNRLSPDGYTFLYIAAQSGCHLVLAVALNFCRTNIDPNLAYNGITPLFIAAQKGYVQVIIQLLKYPNINPNITSPDGLTPLDIARKTGYLPVIEILERHQSQYIH